MVRVKGYKRKGKTVKGFSRKKRGKSPRSKKKFVLKNATFSTCDLEDNHYRVTAAEINFYPKSSVSFWTVVQS